jgi:hypothetical protein
MAKSPISTYRPRTQFGDLAFGDLEIWRFGHLGIGKLGIEKFGGLEYWRLGVAPFGYWQLA